MMCFVVSLEDGGLLSESSLLSGTGAGACYGRQGPSMMRLIAMREEATCKLPAMCPRLGGR